MHYLGNNIVRKNDVPLCRDKIRVCHIFKTYQPDTIGGLERVIEHICLQCDAQKIQNHVVTLSKKPVPAILKRKEAIIHRFPISYDIASSPVSFPMMKEFRKTVSEADILHYHFPWPFADFLHFTSNIKKPVILTYHSDIVKQRFLKVFYQPLMRKFFRCVQQIVVTSDNYLDSSNDLKPYRNKVKTIPVCLDPKQYPDPESRIIDKWRQKVGKDFFLFIGVLRYYKGLYTLIDAVKNTSFKVVVVGDGPMKSTLERKVYQTGNRNVVFTGFIKEQDKMALLNLCRGVVLPSQFRAEAFGVTLLEGAMVGKPLISTELKTGTSFVNRDGITGIVVPPSDVTALKNAMELLMYNDGIALSMGKAAKARFENLFTAPRMGEAYMELYDRIVNGLCNSYS